MLGPDACVWDGSFANNAWLQECPRPITNQVWGNALGLGPADAAEAWAQDRRPGPHRGERRFAGDARRGPAGHAPGVASLTLGYGRTRAGAIGTGVGANAAALRTTRAPWMIEGVALAKTGRRREVLATQNHVRLEREVRDLFPVLSLADLAQGKTVESNTGPYRASTRTIAYTATPGAW